MDEAAEDYWARNDANRSLLLSTGPAILGQSVSTDGRCHDDVLNQIEAQLDDDGDGSSYHASEADSNPVQSSKYMLPTAKLRPRPMGFSSGSQESAEEAQPVGRAGYNRLLAQALYLHPPRRRILP